MEPDRPRFTLQHVPMIVCVVCIWAAQVSIKNHYQQSPFSNLKDVVPRLAEIKTDPIEIKVLGSVTFIIICVAIAFRRHGKITAWSAIAAAFVATLIASVVAAIRYSN
jgi:hypothetical protein